MSLKLCKNMVFNTLKKHVFWIFVTSPRQANSYKYPKHMLYEKIRTGPFLHINLLIKYYVQQQTRFNGNVFGNKCCRCNEGSL